VKLVGSSGSIEPRLDAITSQDPVQQYWFELAMGSQPLTGSIHGGHAPPELTDFGHAPSTHGPLDGSRNWSTRP
jgi:hypothetical protein